jgi:hypothetical protein
MGVSEYEDDGERAGGNTANRLDDQECGSHHLINSHGANNTIGVLLDLIRDITQT